MDGRSLLQYATSKLTPDDANKVVEESDLVFLIGPNWVKFREGQMYMEDGTPVSAGMASVTDVKHLDTLREARRNRADRGEEEDTGEAPPSDDQLRAAGVQNLQHNSSRTIPADAVKEHGAGPFIRNGTQGMADNPIPAREPLNNQTPLDEQGRSNPPTQQRLSPEAQALLDKGKGPPEGSDTRPTGTGDKPNPAPAAQTPSVVHSQKQS